MSETTETSEAAATPADPETLRAVAYCIDALRADPRTTEAVAAFEQVGPMLAAANGVDPAEFPVWDVFQAVTDAWTAAQDRARSETVQEFHAATGARWDDTATVPAE